MFLTRAVALSALTIATVFSQTPKANHDLGFEDTPMLPGLPYHVHDDRRPHPRVVTPAALPGGAPSDAIVLFDGRDLAQWTRAKLDAIHPAALPEPAGWKVGDGYFEVVPHAGDIATREKFGDVQLHLEWEAPAQVRGDSQGRGNSGVFL